LTGPRYFGLRRVNPLLGPVLVVEVDGARALSPNGARWQVELLSQVAVRQPLWADIGPASAERRFFTYGVWGRDTGMRRLPVNPMLGDQSDHPALAPLADALERMPPLPFPSADHLELWLLDARARPIALVSAVKSKRPPTLPTPPAWRALPPAEAAPTAPDEALLAPDAARLERLVSETAGSPARAQWFSRAADGSAAGEGGFRLDPALEGRRLAGESFPELLIRRDLPGGPESEALVDALLAWQAPVLLTLQRLSGPTRARLEPLAARRPTALYRQRRLIPEVVDRPRFEAALVEAVIRAGS